MSYAWIIDTDHQPDRTAPPGTNSNAKGVSGPRDSTFLLLSDLELGQGERFRLYDDDGELYYSGRIVGVYDGFEPLDDFGAPNAGATEIRYQDTSGRWELL